MLLFFKYYRYPPLFYQRHKGWWLQTSGGEMFLLSFSRDLPPACLSKRPHAQTELPRSGGVTGSVTKRRTDEYYKKASK